MLPNDPGDDVETDGGVGLVSLVPGDLPEGDGDQDDVLEHVGDHSALTRRGQSRKPHRRSG